MTTTEAVTQGLLRLALDGAVVRHQAIAANIANAHVQGYAPVKLEFGAELERARDRLLGGADYESVRGEAEMSVTADERGDVAMGLDEQAAALAQNVVHYQALLKGMSKRMSIMAMAINEGGKR